MHQAPKVPGLTYIPSFIIKEEEQGLLDCIGQYRWNTSLKRRTQHFGYNSSYSAKGTLTKAEPIPEVMLEVKAQIEDYLKEAKEQVYKMDQVIVNEYTPGQGISAHIDHTKLFDHTVASLSLSSPTTMVFTHQKDDTTQQLTLQPRSLLILSGESRYDWKHCIPARKSDHSKPRSTRYSLTFRKVIPK